MTCNPGMAVELPGSNVACATLTVRECLTVNGVDITGGGGGGWTDDGAVVRLTTAADQVAVGAALPVGVSPLSVYEAASKWFAVGAVDSFGRRGLWFTMTSSVLRMGANTADGDAFDATSEGAVVWDPAGNKSARIKADRFGLTRAADTSLYYFRVDGSSLFYRADPPGGLVWLNVNRATGEVAMSNQTTSRMESLEDGSGGGGGRVSTTSGPAGARVEGTDDLGATVAELRVSAAATGEGDIQGTVLGVSSASAIAASSLSTSLLTYDYPATGAGIVKTEPGFVTLEANDTAAVKVSEIRVGVQVGVGEVVIGMTGNTLGFLGAAPVVQQGIPAVDAATPIGAALIALGLCYLAP